MSIGQPLFSPIFTLTPLLHLGISFKQGIDAAAPVIWLCVCVEIVVPAMSDDNLDAGQPFIAVSVEKIELADSPT